VKLFRHRFIFYNCFRFRLFLSKSPRVWGHRARVLLRTVGMLWHVGRAWVTREGQGSSGDQWRSVTESKEGPNSTLHCKFVNFKLSITCNIWFFKIENALNILCWFKWELI
jgi:hypothetical protein